MNCLVNKSNFIIRRFSHHHGSVYQTFNIELLYKKVKDNNLKLIEFENKLNEMTNTLEKVTKELNNIKKIIILLKQ
jgi:hypothetical protein